MKRLLSVLVLHVVIVSGLSSVQAQGGRIYSTNFAVTENPISEGGVWINGGAVGIDWNDVRTIPGFAFGTDASGNAFYNDPTALVAGAWAPNQYVQGRVRTVNQPTGNVFQEVEFRLRSTISAHWNSGYEINFRCTHDGSQYVQIVRWNGPLGNFTYVNTAFGPGIRDGDVVSASIVGNVITGYINGVQVIQGTDNTFASGNPGIGFYLAGLANTNADFGFTSFTASEAPISGGPSGGPSAPTSGPSAPTNLRIVPL